MLLVHPVQEIPRSLPALFGIFVAGSTSGNHWWGLTGLVLVLLAGMLRWFTTTYRITPRHVQVRRGLLRRRELSVPRDRVRTVDVTAHAVHRLVGLTRVTVGTGRSDRKDDGVKLDGLTVPEAARLREELLHYRAQPAPTTDPDEPAEPGPDAPETELARLRPGWIRFGPFTLSGFVTVGVLTAFVSRAVNEAHIDLTRYGPLRALVDQLVRMPLGLAVVQVVAVFVVVIALLSTAGYVLAFWGFRLTRHDAGTLHVTRGLVTTRATSIDEQRLRGVELSEPLLLRVVSGARCIAIATGLRVGRGAERRGGPTVRQPAREDP
ncbi:PH domain-containing protein [Micromonospora zhanjiangensis]